MTLLEKQHLFARLVPKLFAYVHNVLHGEVTLGEAWRPPETAALYAKQGKGIATSLHTERLAVDLNLFLGGEYRTDVEAYEPLGLFWTSLHPDCRWGGNFKSRDAVHFSITHGGRQ